MTGRYKGPLIMAAAMLCFSSMGAIVRLMASDIPAMESVFFRGVVGLPVLAFLAARQGVSLRGNRKGLLLARGVFGTIALMLLFFALTKIPVADAMLLNQATPIFVLPLAVIFLSEKVSAKHIALVLTAVCGAVLVIGPGMDVGNLAGAAALCSALFAAVAYVLVRGLTATEQTLTIVFWFTAVSTLGSAPLMASSFVTPSAIQLLGLFAMGGFATGGQLLLTSAYRHSEAGRIAVIGSMGAVFGAGWDYVLWDHIPDGITALGGVMVIASCAGIQVLRHRGAASNRDLGEKKDEPRSSPH